MGAKGQRANFSNPEQVRNFLKIQGRIALAKKVGAGVAASAATGAIGTLGYGLLK